MSWYRKHRVTVNRVLLSVLVILLCAMLFRMFAYDALVNNSSDISKVSTILRDFFYMSAISIAGIWSYYTFVKGRTFEPRAKLAVSLKEVSSKKDLAIFRITITNIGKVKLSSLRGEARFYLGAKDKYGVIYAPYYIEPNVLRNYYNPNIDLILEPGDEINIDTPLIIDGVSNSMLMVNSVFEVGESRIYKENSMFFI